jgi:zinc transport system substrate-binding protein
VPLRVIVSAYPLAQLVSYLGARATDVVDLAGPGAQPQDLAMTPARWSAVRSAALVIDVGDGYQPAVEAAAATARRHLSVLPAISRQVQPYQFWLDPDLMARAAAIVAGALATADPGQRRQFGNGSQDFQSVAASIESDFESTLSGCSRSELVTADDAFGRMAARFDLTDVSVAQAGEKKAAALVAHGPLPAVFSEVGVTSSTLQQVARSTGAAVKTLDPMEVAPATGTTALSYFGLMEEDLTALEGPLACDTSDDS